jgi:diguanylate cyclase (GGDEF)-like protein
VIAHLADRLSSRVPPGKRRAVNTVQVVVVVLVGAFAASSLDLRAEREFAPLIDGWLQGAGYVSCAVLVMLRPLWTRRDRRAWTTVAIAMSLRAAAFVIHLTFLRTRDPVPYPSLADVGWIGMSLLLVFALADVIHARFRRLTTNLVLDGIVGACATAGIALAFLPSTVRDLSPAGTDSAAVITNGLYPVLDVVLLLLVLGALLGYHWHPPPALWVFAAGITGFAILDATFLYQVAHDAYAPGGPLSALSLVATAVIAFSAWVPQSQPGDDRSGYLPGLVVPGVLTALCIGLLVRGAFTDTPPVSIGLTAAGVVAALARTALSFRDVRNLAEARRESRTDDLTGLANRRAFNEALDAAMRDRPPTRPLAVLFLDLDGFKDVNDSLGHHFGDELLALVAPRLEIAIRPTDHVSRIGGDEFAILLDGADRALAANVGERLRNACRGPYLLASRSITVGVSVGISLFPDDGADTTELLQHADMAMYAAKNERSGQSFYRPEHRQASKARLEGIAELRRAIETGEIVLHYQPKVDLRSGQICGVEALVRWQHPTEGLLPPVAFLQQAESGGLMRQLTTHVLGQAVDQWACWRRAGIDTSIAVNLSVGDLLDRQFPSQVVDLLARHDAPGAAIVLELTEDLLLADPTRGHQVIADLLRHDVRVQVDDYGTGYSTLGYLRDLPELGGLKLDRSFVMHLPVDARSVAIVESTIALAASLDLELIAEGVETAAARDKLLELGCHLAQGYFFSKPVPANDVPFGSSLPLPLPGAGPGESRQKYAGST